MSAQSSCKSNLDTDTDPVVSDGSSSPVVDYDDDDDDDGLEEDNEEELSESDEEEEEEVENPNVVWTGYGKRIPVIIFKANNIVTKRAEAKNIGEKYHLAYKLMKTECKLLRSVLSVHGFHEAHPNSSDFNLMWSGSHLKPYVLRGLQEFQKVNHFPRSYEITRKDRLFKNIQRLQQTKGYKNFDFIPSSYIVPGEFQEFCSGYLKDKGPYIVKPIASSRGRGIFLVNHPEQVPLDETMIVSKYIHNPLLVDGFKSDIRLYVAVTSYDPLVIYLYEEGLTRFATVKYDKAAKNIRNQCMHLTNYSVNKKSSEYVSNDDPDVEDYGNKWSLGAMLRYLKSQGKDTTAIMMRIEDVIIKTLISAEMPIATACKMFMPFRGNCFELYGFDIMIDENLRPWVLEVNLSPSLNCDAPIDLKIKSNMMADLFSLVGFVCQDPMMRKMHQGKRNQDINGRPISRTQSATLRPRTPCVKRQRPQSASSNKGTARGSSGGHGGIGSASGLSGEEIRIVRRCKEELQRRGGWIRIFPSPDSWELYGSFLQSPSSHNLMLYQQLYPDRAKTMPAKPTTASFSSSLARTKSFHLHSSTHPQHRSSSQTDEGLSGALQRTRHYERKLSSLGDKNKKPAPANKKKGRSGAGAPMLNGNGLYRGTLVQGIPEDTTPVPRTKPPPASSSSQQKDSHKPSHTSQPAIKAQTIPVTRPKPTQPPPPSATQAQKPGTQGKENTPPKPAPAPTPPETTLNVVAMLEKGRTMSKVQARFAFATYLMRVQQRLLTETSSQQHEDADSANEQMDLVLRFLKRAAGNLQQPFKVTVPSRKLPLNDRRRILAKQLGDFVHIYNKETEILRQRNNLERKHLKRPPNFSQNDGFDEESFIKFVHTASENDLEDVLTTYTKLNKSASIFLGSNSKSSYSGLQQQQLSGSQNNLSSSDPSLVRRKDDTGHRSHQSSREEVLITRAGSHGDISQPMTAVKETANPGSLAANNTLSSYTRAVPIYSSKLGGPGALGGSLRHRPLSAGTSGTHRHGGSRSRPVSASSSSSRQNPRASDRPLYRDSPDGAEAGGDHYDEEAINAALHRLTLRQQQRQYTAGTSQSVHLLDSDTQSAKHTSPNDGHHAASLNGHYQNANETFNNFVEDALSNTEYMEAYEQATGTSLMNGDYSPSPGSTQHHMAQQNLQLKQQRMTQQSRALLEHSRAKHQAMVAQAHAAKHQTYHMLPAETGTLAPKPPPAKPPTERKPASSHRLARTAMLDEDSGDKFYNSLKYDHYRGTAKPVHSSGQNTGY